MEPARPGRLEAAATAPAMADGLIAEKPSFSRGPDGRYVPGVASFQEKM